MTVVTDATYTRLGVRLEEHSDHVTVHLEGERAAVLILFQYVSFNLHPVYRARWIRTPDTLPPAQVLNIATAVGMFLLDKNRGAEH